MQNDAVLTPRIALKLTNYWSSRYYGLYISATYKKYEEHLPKTIKNNGQSVPTVFQIIKAMSGLEELACAQCQNTAFDE